MACSALRVCCLACLPQCLLSCSEQTSCCNLCEVSQLSSQRHQQRCRLLAFGECSSEARSRRRCGQQREVVVGWNLCGWGGGHSTVRKQQFGLHTLTLLGIELLSRAWGIPLARVVWLG